MTAPTGSIPLEKLGPPGTKGELTALAILEKETRSDFSRLHDTEERPFNISARLAKSHSAFDGIKGDFSAEDGESYLLGLPGADWFKTKVDDSTFEFKLNSKGEHSLIELECLANNKDQAKAKFFTAVLPFLDHISYLANTPIVIATLRIVDVKNHCTTIDYKSPYRKATINNHTALIYNELQPVFAMYREAINSNSDFYKFLCYYKILEGLLGPMRAKVYKIAKENGLKLKIPNEKVPDSLYIHHNFKHHVGKSIKEFFDKILTPLFRNAVAHFITDDGGVLNMSSIDHINKYENVMFIVEICTRKVIENHENLLSQFPRPSNA